jgi:hypothetical protein
MPERRIAMKLRLSLLLFLGHGVLQSHGQWFPGSFSFEDLGLSNDCLAAVNVTVGTCPRWLPDYVAQGYVFTVAWMMFIFWTIN